MARDITSDFNTAIIDTVVQPIFAIELELSDGTLRFWTGYGNITMTAGGSSKVFSGLGDFLGISPVSESSTLQMQGINILLTFPSHALRSSCKPFYAAGTPLYTIKDSLAILDGVCDKTGFIRKVIQKSQIYLLIKQVFFNEDNIITDDDIELYLAIIKTIKKETNKNGSKLLVAYILDFESTLMFSSWTNDSILKCIGSE